MPCRLPAQRCRSSTATTASTGAARPAPTASRPGRASRIASAATPVKRTTPSGRSPTSSSWPRRMATSPTSAATGTKGIEPWDFGVPFNRGEAEPMLRGTVFSDRGVYRLGEEVHFKAILRQNTPSGIRLLNPERRSSSRCATARYRIVDERTVTINDWSSAEWTTTLPAEGALGNYSVRAVLEIDKPKPKAPEDVQPGDVPSPELDDAVPYQKAVNGSFLVAAYRRPDFRVDVALKSDRAMAGEPLRGVVTARYLFGAPMGARPVKWALTRSPDPFGAARRRRQVSGTTGGNSSAGASVATPPWREKSAATRAHSRSRASFPLCADATGRRRRAVHVHARGRRRGRLAAAHRQSRQPAGASGAVVHRPSPLVVLSSAEGRAEHRDRDRRAGRSGRRPACR